MRNTKRKTIYLTFICISCVFLILTHFDKFMKNGNERDTNGGSMTQGLTNINTAVKARHYTANVTGVTYTDARPFLLSRSDSDEVLKAPPLQFLTDVKNPCFALADNYVNVGNITMSYALQKGYEIRCLPYVFQAGFTKSGTGDIFLKSTSHTLLTGYCQSREYKRYNINSPMTDCTGKEAHFWDNMYLHENYTLDAYTKTFPVNNIASSFQDKFESSEQDYRNMIYMDATPRMVWHGDTWHEEESNRGLEAPEVLLPHKIHHINPNAKFMITMRNPVSRLFSDYKFFFNKQNPTAMDFHNKVVDAIAWWRKCVTLYPLRACAYGIAPPGLMEHGFEKCIKNKTFTLEMRKNNEGVCQSVYGWTPSAASRLRVSMYDIYVAEWLKLFPIKNFLFIKFEDYVVDPLAYTETYILPFLDLPPFNEEEKTLFREELARVKNQSKSTVAMLDETKKILDEFYKESQEHLCRLLNDDKFNWIQ